MTPAVSIIFTGLNDSIDYLCREDEFPLLRKSGGTVFVRFTGPRPGSTSIQSVRTLAALAITYGSRVSGLRKTFGIIGNRRTGSLPNLISWD